MAAELDRIQCWECGDRFRPTRATQRFCCSAHRSAWQNRRSLRGAELFDLFMALRFCRGWARAVGLYQLACRLASEWKREDDQAGRVCFERPDRWIHQNRAALTCKKVS